MNKVIKLISILMIAAMLIMIVTPTFAVSPNQITITENNVDKVTGIGNSILGIIKVVGTIIAVGGLLFMGIKYIMGSVEEKAEYKKTFIPYVIGCVLLFAAANLAEIIYTWASGL